MTTENAQIIFDDVQSSRLVTISEYYEVAKELIIFGEEIDPENRSLPQPINELRHCLDHLTRAILYKVGLRHMNEGIEYLNSNLEKAYGHVYRAVYDSLDWVSLTLKGRIYDEMKDFSLDTIQAVMPEYFQDIKPRLEKMLYQDIASLRMEKDVVVTNEQNLITYGNLIIEMKELFERVITHKSSLVEYENKLTESERRSKRSKFVDRVWQIALALITGGAIYWLLDRFLFSNPPS